MARIDSILGTIIDRVADRLRDPNVPVNNSEVSAVAVAAAQAIEPIIVNATNSEHWTQSRILRGLIVAGVGYVASRFGYMITEGDVTEAIQFGASAIELGGLAYAWFGRVVGSRKAPIGVK